MKSTMKQPKLTPCDYEEITSIQFSVFSQEQIQSYSTLEITDGQFYENNSPSKGGLFDERLGVSGPNQRCFTCGETVQCPGHFGHIKLSEPVLHYGFLDIIIKILKCICHHCFRLKRGCNKQAKERMKQIKRVIDPERRLLLMVKLLEKTKKCNFSHQQDLFDKNYKPCGATGPVSILKKNQKICFVNSSKETHIFTRREIIKLLQGISQYQSQCESMGFVTTKPIDLIINNLLIPPPQIRPHVLMNGQVKIEDDLSFAYQKIFRLNSQIERKCLTATERNQKIDLIQRTIASIMIKLKPKPDQSKNRNSLKRQVNKKIKSISERLEGKQGRFRQNLLGKRVDFAARTVITPDPNLKINEVGVPEKIAKNLTIPQKVTITNYDRIIDLCLQKKVKYLINPPELNLRNQQVAINVSKLQALSRQELSSYVNVGMSAQRVLQNGDYALLNRQPTLHRMSMMAHKIRILPHNTFRINPCVCMPYNADFDGDEMNIHIPQSYQSVSQLKNISIVQNQIVGPKNGTTSLGFSQDSLLGICLITSRDTFINKEDMMNLLTKIDDEDILQLPMPAIMKPQALWTGKQLISIIIPKQIQIKHYKNGKDTSLSNLQQKSLIIKKGELISGFLQKQFIGSSSNLNNIIHYVWMQIGPFGAQKLINNLQKIANNWLVITGFSLGVSDLIPKKEIVIKKQQQQQQIQKLFYNTLDKFRNEKQIKKHHLHQQGKKIMDSFQYNINLQLNNRLSKIQEIIKNVENYSKNNIYKIVEIKSKGSETNLAQIFYSVGNQNINGQRCPLGFNRRSLPHFFKDDHSPIARGYVMSSFYQGLKPHELFFHSMGGRQGLSDTAIKTSHVGYIQRKIIKSLEDLIVKYDSSVRDSKNNLLQSFYGQDGFCSEYIQRHRCVGAESTRQRFRQMYKWKEDQLKKIYRYSPYQIKIIKREYSRIYQSRKVFRQIFCKNVETPTYDYYCPINIEKLIHKMIYQSQMDGQNSQKAQPLQICEKVQKLLEQCYLPALKGLKQSKPIQINPQENEKDQYESFSDQFQRQDQNEFKNYNKKVQKVYSQQFQIFKIHLRFSLSSKLLIKTRGIKTASFNQLLSEIKAKYFKSLAPAGQAVGCLAAQSIGQPTTQMTLNTFHLAGISDKNVTLGLPRLSQLLQCSKQIKNQMVTIFPYRPILETQSIKPQNQAYLLDMLLYHLPQRKVGDFIISTHFKFNPKQRNFLLQCQEGIINQNKKTSCQIIFVFCYSKVGSKKIWNQIIQKIQKKSGKSYSLQIITEFNDISSKNQNPKISITQISFYNQHNSQNNHKQQKLFTNLQALQSTIKQMPICGINGIKTVQLSKKSLCLDQKIGVKQYSILQAYGSGFKQCLQHMMVNSIKTYTNNIQQIYMVLGIQAARQAILNQLKQVLKPYGISINYRHLSVLADWMCCKGTLIPVNRHGLHKLKNLSTLTKASYQMPTKMLFKAASFSTKDDLKQTTSHIIFGQSTQCGTSQCQLLIDPQNVIKYSYKPQQNVKDIETDLQIQIIEKTPYIQSDTYDNSFLGRKNNLVSSPFNSRSPGYNISLSPNILPFSPTYISMNQTATHAQSISPRYGNVSSRANYSSISPSYSRSKILNSPTYNGLSSSYLNRQKASCVSVLNKKLSSVGQTIGKKEQQQCSDNEETQRTQFKQYKQEDQF